MSMIKHRVFLALLWFIALSLTIYHGLLAFYSWMPTSHWLVYHGVVPIQKEYKVNETLKFRSHTDLHRNVILTFNDILFCREPIANDFERYSSQNTKRLHVAVSGKHYDRYTVWPYSPGVAFPTECYLESNINIHLPFNTTRHIRYDGLLNKNTFKIVEEP
jgi:hypothetical protein